MYNDLAILYVIQAASCDLAITAASLPALHSLLPRVFPRIVTKKARDKKGKLFVEYDSEGFRKYRSHFTGNPTPAPSLADTAEYEEDMLKIGSRGKQHRVTPLQTRVSRYLRQGPAWPDEPVPNHMRMSSTTYSIPIYFNESMPIRDHATQADSKRQIPVSTTYTRKNSTLFCPGILGAPPSTPLPFIPPTKASNSPPSSRHTSLTPAPLSVPSRTLSNRPANISPGNPSNTLEQSMPATTPSRTPRIPRTPASARANTALNSSAKSLNNAPISLVTIGTPARIPAANGPAYSQAYSFSNSSARNHAGNTPKRTNTFGEIPAFDIVKPLTIPSTKTKSNTLTPNEQRGPGNVTPVSPKSKISLFPPTSNLPPTHSVKSPGMRTPPTPPPTKPPPSLPLRQVKGILKGGPNYTVNTDQQMRKVARVTMFPTYPDPVQTVWEECKEHSKRF